MAAKWTGLAILIIIDPAVNSQVSGNSESVNYIVCGLFNINKQF